MSDWYLLLRWSWRDLRKYWVKVIAIALVIGIGTGAYASLTSMTTWRRASNEASMDRLNMYDVRFELAGAGFIAAGRMEAAVAGIEHANWVTGAEERLVRPTQVDASTPDDTILVPGLLVGRDISDGNPTVNGWHIETGAALTPADAGEPFVLLEYSFLLNNDLPGSGEIVISGGEQLTYTGGAMTPEFFVVVPENSTTFAMGTYAGVFTSLETAQRLTGMEGVVNDLVVTIADDADRGIVTAEIESAMEALGFGTDVTMREDDLSYRLLYEDVENDQQMMVVFAILIFGGAVMGAFNLITRLAEAQRREIGISMALGVAPRKIALRPLMVGAQIALLGGAFGVFFGVVIGRMMRDLLIRMIPLPIWQTDFQWDLFVWVAVVGFIVPFIATAYPVWRAVRVKPIEAIRTGHLAARGGGLAPLIKRIPLPGDSFAQLPMRNLLRAPRRSVMTILGIGAVMAVVVGFLGSVDSYLGASVCAANSIEGDSPDRLVVTFERVLPTEAPLVATIEDAASVGRTQHILQLGALAHGEKDVDLLLEVLDLDNDLWQPTIIEGSLTGIGNGLILSQAAAEDLGVTVGGTISMSHPVRTGEGAFSLATSEITVAGLHDSPLRFAAYLDDAALEVVNAAGLANVVYAEPAPGFEPGDVQRELFYLDSVSSVEKASAAAQELGDFMDQFISILRVVAVFVLLIAVLMAFNSASIGFEERQREHATMFAYGVRVRKALRLAIVENTVIGVVATAIGLAGGLGIIWWVVKVNAVKTMPSIGFDIDISPATLAIVVVLGIAAVALAPLFTASRMRRMDVPGTLRVME